MKISSEKNDRVCKDVCSVSRSKHSQSGDKTYSHHSTPPPPPPMAHRPQLAGVGQKYSIPTCTTVTLHVTVPQNKVFLLSQTYFFFIKCVLKIDPLIIYGQLFEHFFSKYSSPKIMTGSGYRLGIQRSLVRIPKVTNTLPHFIYVLSVRKTYRASKKIPVFFL